MNTFRKNTKALHNDENEDIVRHTPNAINQFLKKNNLWAKKRLGQNFLINNHILQKIVEAAEIKNDDTILEIGPGLGTLTHELMKKAHNVISIEKDKNFIPLLKDQFQKYNNITIIQNDALKHPPPSQRYKIVANIPYYITSPLINHFLKEQFLNDGTPPTLIVILTQKEVAEKITEKDGKKSVISFNVQTFGKAKIIARVGAKNFYPAPKVDSAILKIEVYKKPVVHCDLKNYFHLIEIGFQAKRKTLLNALSHGLKKDKKSVEEFLKKADISPQIRAEKLKISDWERLALTPINGIQ